MKPSESPLSNRRLFLSATRPVARGRPLIRPPRFMRSGRGAWVLPVRPDSLAPLGVIALNRLAFGPCPGDMDDFQSRGNNDAKRLEDYCEEQLHPESIDDTQLRQTLTESGFTTLEQSQSQLWQERVVPRPSYKTRMRSIMEVERAAFVRAVLSRRQLCEVLADFWHNHFNVYGWDYSIGPNFSAYDRDAIRAHMLGNFREMLEAVASSSNMLFYLDNYLSSNAGPNENYARELFELHTLGAQSYLGVQRQLDVERDEEGLPIGYVDDDVYEATRCFTGWTVNEDNGELEHRNDWHDRFQKMVLGQWLPADQPPLQDGRDLLDVLAAHPATARHISWKLARRLLADDPPQTVVDSAARVFLDEINSPDQLRRVVRSIVLSDAFQQTWGKKVKRPFEVVVSFFRATGTRLTMGFEDRFSDRLLYQYWHTGQPLFQWPAPDGYPEEKENWLGSTTFVQLWRLLSWLVVEDEDDRYALPILEETPAWAETPNQLVDFWSDRMLGRKLPAAARREIVDFMAQGRNPDYPIRLEEKGVPDRVRSVVALIGMSPQFLER